MAVGVWGKLITSLHRILLWLTPVNQVVEATTSGVVQFKRLSVLVIAAVLLFQVVVLTSLDQHIFIVTRQEEKVHVSFSTEQNMPWGCKRLFYNLISQYMVADRKCGSRTNALPLYFKQLIYVWSWTLIQLGWNAGNFKDPSSACPVHTQTNGAGAWLGRWRPTGVPTAGQGDRM